MAVSDREFGELSQRVHSLEDSAREIKADVKAGNVVADQILHKLSAAEGGWKMLASVAAFGAAVGGLIVKLLPFGAVKL